MTPPPKKSETPNEPGSLPGFLTVGTPTRTRRNSHASDRLAKLLSWYDAALPQLKATGSTDVGVPAEKLAQEFGVDLPKNPHSLRSNLMRAFQDLSVDGRTVEIALRQDAGKFTFWFHAVKASKPNQ